MIINVSRSCYITSPIICRSRIFGRFPVWAINFPRWSLSRFGSKNTLHSYVHGITARLCLFPPLLLIQCLFAWQVEIRKYSEQKGLYLKYSILLGDSTAYAVGTNKPSGMGTIRFPIRASALVHWSKIFVLLQRSIPWPISCMDRSCDVIIQNNGTFTWYEHNQVVKVPTSHRTCLPSYDHYKLYVHKQAKWLPLWCKRELG